MTALPDRSALVVPYSVAERLGAQMRNRLARAGMDLPINAMPFSDLFWADQVQALLLSAREEIAAMAAMDDETASGGAGAGRAAAVFPLGDTPMGPILRDSTGDDGGAG